MYGSSEPDYEDKLGVTATIIFIYRLTNSDSVLSFILDSEWPLVFGMRNRYEDSCTVELYVRPNEANFRGPIATESEANHSYICYVERRGPKEILA